MATLNNPGRVPMAITISPSALRAFQACEYRYVATYMLLLRRAERRPVRRLIFGTILHGVIARFIDDGGWDHFTEDDLVDFLEQAWQPAIYADPGIAQANFDRAAEMLQRFYRLRYPPDAAQEVGTEMRLTWGRRRDGVLATGVLDRVVLTRDHRLIVIDYKTSPRPPGSTLQADVGALIYRSLAADHFKHLNPAAIVIAYHYLPQDLVITAIYDRPTFDAAWRRIETAVARIRQGIEAVLRGAAVVDEFPRRRGLQCDWCPLLDHCARALEVNAQADRGRLDGGAA